MPIWLERSSAETIAEGMDDDVQLGLIVEKIKVYCLRKPSREVRSKIRDRLKAVAKHELVVEGPMIFLSSLRL